MLNPSILSSHFWEKHKEYFRVTNGELFQTNLITKKPVGIQFFPNCVLWIKIVGSNLPDKDILIGFDILHLIKNLHVTASRIRYKQMKAIVNFHIHLHCGKMKTSSLSFPLSLTKTSILPKLPILV